MTEQEISAHLCGCMKSSPEERMQFGKVHAGQCVPCKEKCCPLFGQQISLPKLREHEASHRALPTKLEELTPGVEEKLRVALEGALPVLDKTLRDLEEAKRPNPDLAGMVFGGSSSTKSTPLTEEFLAGCDEAVQHLDLTASPLVREARAMSKIPSGARQQMVGAPDETVGGNPT